MWIPHAPPAPAVAVDAAEKGVRLATLLVEPDGHGLSELARLVEAGRLRVAIDTVLPLERAATAHELGETGRTTGKIVLAVAP